MKQYFSFWEFYAAYEESGRSRNHIPLNEIDQLIARLREEGCSVRELKDSRIIVRTPEEIRVSKDKRKAKQAEAASRYAKLGASFPKETVKQFADACRTLGVTQSEILMPIVEDTIIKAESVKVTSNSVDI